MTHDELLTRITIVRDTSIEEALRAVVELATTETVSISENGERFYDGFHYALKCVIETIEKELNG